MKEMGARLRNLPRDTKDCLAFFSRLPVGAGATLSDFRTSAAAWPLAGGVIMLVPAALLWLSLSINLPGVIAATIAIGSAAIITGALHEDGLADMADGFGGGATADEKLDIMRDSRLGSYGALALIFSILLRVTSLALIAVNANGVIALFAIALLSRSLALWHWNFLEPARKDGLAVSAGQPDWRALSIGTGLGAVGLIVLLLGFGGSSIYAVLAAALIIIAFTKLAEHQINGHTGDTIGAAQQIAETVLLAGLAAGWETFPAG